MEKPSERTQDIFALAMALLFTAFFIYKVSHPGENAMSNESVRITLVVAGIVFSGGGSIVLLVRLLRKKY